MERDVFDYWAGGALGFDTLAAQTVLSMRTQYPALHLNLALPCPTQTQGWAARDCVLYEQIKQQADSYVYLPPFYTPTCMSRRNRYLVEHSSYCVGYCTKKQSGTGYTMEYARKLEKIVFNLAYEIHSQSEPEQISFF